MLYELLIMIQIICNNYHLNLLHMYSKYLELYYINFSFYKETNYNVTQLPYSSAYHLGCLMTLPSKEALNREV